MRIWILSPALALAALCSLALLGTGPARLAETGAPLQVAAIPEPDSMTDACVWTAEVAAAGDHDQCGEVRAAEPQARALVWPNDFIAITTGAAADVWDAAIGFLTGIYEYAFGDEQPPRQAGS